MENLSVFALEISNTSSDLSAASLDVSVNNPEAPLQISKQAIRHSLKASTLDGIFAAIFSSITSGVLLTNFLLNLGANSVEIGMLSSIPMIVNLLQPLGAYFADRTNSRHNYCLWIFGISRLLWLILGVGIGWVSWSHANAHLLVHWTLAIILAASILSGLGGSAWVSWMAVLVPHRLRGRYFGFRNSLASLTTLISVPLFGFLVSAWQGGTLEGYGVVLVLGIVAGLISLGCQFFMEDVNPQHPPVVSRSVRVKANKETENIPASPSPRVCVSSTSLPYKRSTPNSLPHSPATNPLWQDRNFLIFLLYFALWMFAVNLSNPFFNLYMLDNLAIDVSWVTLYTSLASAANLVLLLWWGKLADRWGNRPLLLLVGVLVAVVPIFWLGAGRDTLTLWVWLPLLHLVNSGAWAAIDLCSSNIQMEIAPLDHPTRYFAIAAAVAGVSGALGTTVGGFLANVDLLGGLPGLFTLSVGARLVALLPLVFVTEPRSQSVMHIWQNLWRFKPPSELIPAESMADSAK